MFSVIDIVTVVVVVVSEIQTYDEGRFKMAFNLEFQDKHSTSF